MRLADLKEMAFRHSPGFDISQQEWDLEFKTFGGKVEKQLNDRSFVESKKDEDTITYALVIKGEVVAMAKLKPRIILGKHYEDLKIICSNPSKTNHGFASLLLWELYLFLENPLFIGGAIAPKGEALIISFMKKHLNVLDKVPKVLDPLTGETFDVSRWFNQTRYGLVLECFPMDNSRSSIGGRKLWIFNEEFK